MNSQSEVTWTVMPIGSMFASSLPGIRKSEDAGLAQGAAGIRAGAQGWV